VSDAAAFVLSGAFVFPYQCHYFSYLASRTEGCQLLFRVAAATACLVVFSYLLPTLGSGLPGQSSVRAAWPFASPPDIPPLPVYLTAFVLGPILASIVNPFHNADRTSTRAIPRYSTDKERLLFGAMEKRTLVSVTMENRKVYRGWSVYSPDLGHKTNDSDSCPSSAATAKKATSLRSSPPTTATPTTR
jgi:hypothetical protein